jgi:hypothetical protein
MESKRGWGHKQKAERRMGDLTNELTDETGEYARVSQESRQYAVGARA